MANLIFCSQCGTSLDAQARFCPKCGTTIAPGPAALAATASAVPATPSQSMTAAPPAMPSPYGSVPPGYVQQPGYPGMVAATPGILPYAGFWMRVGAYLIDFLVLVVPTFILGLVPFLGIIVNIVGVWLYFALQESSERQATIGKRALNIYVADEQGRRISFGQATARHFSKILSGIILCIGYIMVAFTEKKQGLHDMIAGTIVGRR